MAMAGPTMTLAGSLLSLIRWGLAEFPRRLVVMKSTWLYGRGFRRWTSSTANDVKRRRHYFPYLRGSQKLPYRLPTAVVAVDKPEGWTPYDVLVRIRTLILAKLDELEYFSKVKSGWRADVQLEHGGFLDRTASGIVLIGINHPHFQQYAPKSADYIGTISLGKETRTMVWPPQSITRTALYEHVTFQQLQEAAERMQNTMVQTQFGTDWRGIGGTRVQESTKWGKAVDRNRMEIEKHYLPEKILVENLRVVEYDPPDVHFECTVDVATSILAVGQELARHVESAGFITHLRRTRQGPFRVEKALSVERLSSLEDLEECFLEYGEQFEEMVESIERKRATEAEEQKQREMEEEDKLMESWRRNRLEVSKAKKNEVKSEKNVVEREGKVELVGRRRGRNKDVVVDAKTLLDLLKPMDLTPNENRDHRNQR